MIYVGVDPGASGGIAIINMNAPGGPLAAHKMPDTEAKVCAFLTDLLSGRGGVFTVVEKVGGYVGGGPVCPACHQVRNTSPGSSMFNFGRGVGVLVGCLLTLGTSFEEVEPQRWQSMLGLKRPKQMSQQDWKRELKKTAQELYPDIKVTLWSCDAILLARYARLSQEGVVAPEALD